MPQRIHFGLACCICLTSKIILHSKVCVTNKVSNLYILLYRSAYLAAKEDQGAGNVALQAACRNTRITEDVLAQDLVQHLNVHMYVSALFCVMISTNNVPAQRVYLILFVSTLFAFAGHRTPLENWRNTGPSCAFLAFASWPKHGT